MSRSSPTFRRLGLVRAYFPTALALLVWLGMLAVAWVSLGGLPSHRPAARPDTPRPRPAARAHTPKPDAATPRHEVVPPVDSNVDSNVVQPAPEPEPRADDAPQPDEDASAKTTPTPPAHPVAPTAGKPDHPPASSASASPGAAPSVARAQLTRGIHNREPVDRITGTFHSRRKPLRRVYYFTEVTGLSGQTVTHRWWHEGRLVARITFQIGSDSWRMYSVKKLIPRMTGQWRVVMTDDQGNTLSTAGFVYEAP